MRRVLATLGPIALLTSGCVERAYTPSDLLPAAQPQPEAKVVQVPARDEAIARWQLPSTNPWAPYEKFTLLTALDTSTQRAELPDVDRLDSVNRARNAAQAIAAAGVLRDAMWIVDLRGAASVAFGSTLTRTARESIAAIPTFNNWPADDELVPAEETLAAMVQMPPRLPAPDDVASRPFFLLDAWRLAYKTETIEEEVTDNRYMLSSIDFPSAEDLREHGISRVIYVVEDAEEVDREEDDLHALFLAYQQAGIRIALVDLSWFTRPRDADEEPWPRAIDRRVIVIEPRLTIVEDPAFYGRARGGFGGVHGAPPFQGGHFGGHVGGHFGGHFGGHGGG